MPSGSAEPVSDEPGPAPTTTGAPDMVWWGWGSADHHRPLSPAATAMLTQLLGIDGAPGSHPEPPRPVASRLTDAEIGVLTDCVGIGHVSTDDPTRVAHCRGKSTQDLLQIRAGNVHDAPDAVVFPRSHDEVQAILLACVDLAIAVVPFGGGSSVVGGLAMDGHRPRAVIALDLRRMNALISVDAESLTATLQPGLRGPQVEAVLADHGLTLGHFPQSFEYASVGGFAATRSSGQASAGYGRFDQLVVAVTLATPVGTWRLSRGPHTAAGPDLRQLVLGSEGAFGVITEVTVMVRPAPAKRQYEGWQVPSFSAGIDLLRRLAQHDLLPTVVRLSDEVETAAGLANATGVGERTASGCYLLLGLEGSAADVAARHAAIQPHLTGAGASRAGPALGEDWLLGRFHGPYLRDALLDIGGFAETFETVTAWSALPALYAAARQAAVTALTSAVADSGADRVGVLVLCHISHVYRSGASLYFTVICRLPDDPIAAWDRVKATITDVIVAAGGSITHHHGVGTTHRPWLSHEIGPIGVRVLAAVKDVVDPTGILNPGVLIETGRVGPSSAVVAESG